MSSSIFVFKPKKIDQEQIQNYNDSQSSYIQYSLNNEIQVGKFEVTNSNTEVQDDFSNLTIQSSDVKVDTKKHKESSVISAESNVEVHSDNDKTHQRL